MMYQYELIKNKMLYLRERIKILEAEIKLLREHVLNQEKFVVDTTLKLEQTKTLLRQKVLIGHYGERFFPQKIKSGWTEKNSKKIEKAMFTIFGDIN